MRMLTSAMKIAMWVVGVALAFLIVVYLGVSLMIAGGVNNTSQTALAQFDGDRIEALIALVDCQDCSLRDRNHAVWALGQLTDKRALPILYKYRTGKPCDHMREICQYEISKAIRWTEGNSFMLPQIWRVLLRDDHRSASKSTK
ncbi:MAG TPA: hypothetical protein VE398_11020 [Acidobacteriota bacterium]|nr:hypothetical protein [Acidobacteriota bacterium]